MSFSFSLLVLVTVLFSVALESVTNNSVVVVVMIMMLTMTLERKPSCSLPFPKTRTFDATTRDVTHETKKRKLTNVTNTSNANGNDKTKLRTTKSTLVDHNAICRWEHVKCRMDPYCNRIYSLFRSSDDAKIVAVDYVSSMSSKYGVNPDTIVQYRLNSINWASHYFEMRKFSMSTASLYVDIFDRYMANTFLRNARQPDTSPNRCGIRWFFKNTAEMTCTSILLVRLLMKYNEDRPYLLTNEDVNKYLPDASMISKVDFMKKERLVLMALDFKFFDESSPKTILEMFISIFPHMLGYKDTMERVIFPFYCRFVFDALRLCYPVMAEYGARDVLMCCIYLSKLCWPENYCEIIKKRKSSPPASQPESGNNEMCRDRCPTPEKIFRRVCNLSKETWVCNIMDAFGIEYEELNAKTYSILARFYDFRGYASKTSITHINETGNPYADCNMIVKYRETEVGCVGNIGFPTLEEFSCCRRPS